MDPAPLNPSVDKFDVFNDVILDVIIRHRVLGLNHNRNFFRGIGSCFLIFLGTFEVFHLVGQWRRMECVECLGLGRQVLDEQSVVLVQVDDALEDKAVVPFTITTNLQTVVRSPDIFQYVECRLAVRPESKAHKAGLGVVGNRTFQKGDIMAEVKDTVQPRRFYPVGRHRVAVEPEQTVRCLILGVGDEAATGLGDGKYLVTELDDVHAPVRRLEILQPIAEQNQFRDIVQVVVGDVVGLRQTVLG
jgi:hypothetical protein